MKRVKYTRNPTIEEHPLVNFRDSLKRLAEEMPDKAVYLYSRHRVDHSLSYGQFYLNIKHFGTALSLSGLAGKPLAVISETDPSYMTSYYAVISTGGIIVPLDRDISDEETVGFLKKAGVKAVVLGETQNSRLSFLREALPEVELFIPVYPTDEMAGNERTKSFDDLLLMGKEACENGNDFFENFPQDVEKCSVIIFTSGTTGTGKGVMLSQKNLISTVMASVDVIDQLGSETIVMSVLPLHHTYEVATGQMGSHFYGATVAINDSLKYFMKNMGKYKPDYLVLVPLFIETLHKKTWEEIRRQGKEKKVRFFMKVSNFLLFFGIDLRRKFFGQILASFGGNLTAVVSGGAKLNPECIKDFRALGIEVQEGYGITECSPLVAANPINKNKPGTVGPAVLGVDVKIEGTDKPGVTGEILVKGPNVMLGYLDNEEATKEAFTEDGYYRTGDIGCLDKDGYITITGRKKNIIILSNGKNIYPEELEEHLSSCPLFLESAVVGREQNGETVITAVIYPDYAAFEGKTESEIEEEVKVKLNEINRTLPQYKQMRGLEIRKTEFEKTSSRKIKRYKI